MGTSALKWAKLRGEIVEAVCTRFEASDDGVMRDTPEVENAKLGRTKLRTNKLKLG